MELKEFEELKVGDLVMVKAWEEIAEFTPKVLKRHCGKTYRVAAISNGTAALEERKNGKIHGVIFSHEALNKADLGRLYIAGYPDKDKSIGNIGEKTDMTDFDGRPLFVGDIVNITCISKELTESKSDNPLIKALGKFLTSTITQVVCKDDEDGGFVMGIADQYSDKFQNTKKYKVVKIVDHSAVKNGAQIDKVCFENNLI